jgi:hypothetical protein
LIFLGSLEENPFILNFIELNQWVIAASSPEEMKDLKLLLEKITANIDSGKFNIFRTTLNYLLLKIVWLKTISNLRVRRNGLRSEKVMKLFAEMKINHSEHRGLTYYSQQIHVSENYLGELCQKETGLSFRMISNLWLIIRILDSFYLQIGILVRLPTFMDSRIKPTSIISSKSICKLLLRSLGKES